MWTNRLDLTQVKTIQLPWSWPILLEVTGRVEMWRNLFESTQLAKSWFAEHSEKVNREGRKCRQIDSVQLRLTRLIFLEVDPSCQRLICKTLRKTTARKQIEMTCLSWSWPVKLEVMHLSLDTPHPPNPRETWGISHGAKANEDNAPHTGDIFAGQAPTKWE